MKKGVNLFIFGIIAVVLIVVLAFLFTNNSESSSNSGGLLTLDDKEKYALFEADFACRTISITNEEEALDVFNEFESIAESYGYTMEDIEKNSQKYAEDEDFLMLVFNEMKKQCPDEMEVAGINKFVF